MNPKPASVARTLRPLTSTSELSSSPAAAGRASADSERGVHRLRRRFMAALVSTVVVVCVLASGTQPAAANEGRPATYLEIDIANQVLSVVTDGQVEWSTHVSTGSEEWYWNGWDWERAHTPRGWFEIYWFDEGWVEAPLGWLYNAMYFTGGFAIHGSESVPYYPASHGCVRVSLEDAEWLFARIGYGTPVLVHD